MAVGGMIGGGIFSTLGVVIAVAGEWAWLSFLLGGIVALASGHSYSALTRQLDKTGGAYTFLQEIGWHRAATVTVWTLLVGYILTVAVYAVTFGSYAAYAFGAPEWVKLLAGVAAIAALAGINLMGAHEATVLEKIAVSGKLIILLGLAGLGLAQWNPERLMLDSSHPTGFGGALIGMGVVFVAYEGFQLLSYDYDEMVHPARTIRIAMPSAILVTMVTYIVVALGAAMLAGAPEIVKREEVALAVAGREALGVAGFIAVSIAATFSAGSAINATIFATSRLAERAAREGSMPAVFGRKDKHGVPWFGTLVIAGVAAVLTLVGGIQTLVEGASLVFLIVFAVVNAIGWHLRAGIRWIAAVGFIGSVAGTVMLVLYLAGVV